MSTLLEVKDITKIYPNQPKPGLDHVSFEVMQGEFLGIMGASGSGKTTLLNVLSTIDIPTSGSIRMGGKKIQELNQTQAVDFRKNNLGFIFQEYFLLDSLTVQENIAVPLTLLHESAKTIDKKVMELAELFGIASQLKKYPSELSGGQRQRVWVAMILAQQTEILLLDEPTTYLDINHQLEIMELLKRLNKEQNLTVLMVLHELTQAVQYSHYMAVIKEGHLVTSGETNKIISDELFRDVFSVDVQLDTFDNKKYVRVKGLVE